ncbi:MAG: SDR family oxidoreductase [Verrucomicrobia bacterium]|nr:SDR family oxidoreductase [Verrucomicrobiota bacterium]
MPTLFITGANRGIGLQFVKKYAEDQWHVIACCRNPSSAKELKSLAKSHPSIEIEALDVSDYQQIKTLAAKLKGKPIDLLLNNAGIYSGRSGISAETGDRDQDFGQIDPIAWEQVLRVNTISPILVIEAFLPHMKKGTGKKIVNISSSMGSMTEMDGGAIAYRTSKAGLNAAMRVIFQDLHDLGIAIVNFHPGWVITDMGGKGADLTTEKSVDFMRRTIDGLKLKDSGQFLNYDGKTIAW